MYTTEISNRDLVGMPTFPAVATKLNQWFEETLNGKSSAVLVSHNTATDIQFLICDYLRAGMNLPTQFKLGLDTLQTLRRYSSLPYRKVDTLEWSRICADCDNKGLTKSGKLSMGVKPCATYALSKRSPPEIFTDACGEHHDADADTRAVAVILFDMHIKGGLYDCVFKSSKRCCLPLQDVWDAMEIKLKEPVISIEEVPEGWIPAANEDACNKLSSSSSELPPEVNEVKEKPFVSPSTQRGEGQPSSKLKTHLGIGSARSSGTAVSVTKMMLMLFMFFFAMPTLNKIAEFTNAKAMEIVIKTRCVKKDGSFYNNVSSKNQIIISITHLLSLFMYTLYFTGDQIAGTWQFRRTTCQGLGPSHCRRVVSLDGHHLQDGHPRPF